MEVKKVVEGYTDMHSHVLGNEDLRFTDTAKSWNQFLVTNNILIESCEIRNKPNNEIVIWITLIKEDVNASGRVIVKTDIIDKKSFLA